jgi:hypothetical protein
MVQYHTRGKKKETNVLSSVLPRSKLSPKIKRPILTPPSKIIMCLQSAYIEDCRHGSILGGGGSIGRQFLRESLKVHKYLKKVVFDIAQYKGDPHRMKTCLRMSVAKKSLSPAPRSQKNHRTQKIIGRQCKPRKEG